MSRLLTPLLGDIDFRAVAALVRAFVVMDLRGQHYARATATKPHFLLSPLFLVVGQCLTLSALVSLVLFARVDLQFYAFAGLSIGMLVLATTILVEFQEIVLDPRDLDVIGHRPITPGTYAAARFANLLFYFALMFLALNLFPLLLGFGLRDGNFWYLPAYLLASLAGSLVVTALVLLALSLAQLSPKLDGVKEVLAWTQILLILVVFYAGQLVLRDGRHVVQMWAADPPPWTRWLPSMWLAWFVDLAVTSPIEALPWAALLLTVAAASVAAIVLRLSSMYRAMQPATRDGRRRSMAAHAVGSLRAPWPARSIGQRVGYWMCRTLLIRDADLGMRCLLTFNLAVAVVVLGAATAQFANPAAEPGAARAVAAVAAVYLIPMALPVIVHHLTFCTDADASWLLLASPLDGGGELGEGACLAVLHWLALPMCAALAVVAGILWADWPAALLHASLALALCWPAALAGLWLVPRAPLFTLPPVRGGSLGLPPLPFAAISSVGGLLGAAHLMLAWSPWFWLAMALLIVGLSVWLRGLARHRLQLLWRPE